MMPDYKGGSIVNLMSSIMSACGAKSQYKTLRHLSPAEMKSKNIVLLVIDGLGHDYVMNAKKSYLRSQIKGKMTSVFPPTTAAAITTFMTGLAPHNHGITGWYMFLKEFGTIVAPLPFISRYGGPELSAINPFASEIFDHKSVFDKLKVKTFIVQDAELIDSAYTNAHAGRAKKLACTTFDSLAKQVKKVVSGKGKKFVYAYWPEFDHICHLDGKASKSAARHYNFLDRKIRKFVKSIKGTDTTVIIVADHGHIDTVKSKMLFVENHPVLADSLTVPLSGEPRAAYCFVRPSKTRQFEAYVRKKLSTVCSLQKSSDLIKKNCYGLFKPHPKLKDRIGDYVLLMKKNYVFRDSLLGKLPRIHIGNHGGISEEEMFVPLIVVKA